jgi:NAD(P)-dependent dehydrogenase (short-subunit alcohol dehydrogenase family)
MTFSGRVCAVTGAASGIGRALANELASCGADLAICDVDETGLRGTAEQVKAKGRRVYTQRVDVADRKSVHAFADNVVKELGRVDAIVNNAGVAVAENFEDLSYEDLEWIMGINFWGVVHGSKAFLPYLRKNGDGWIVNISSVFGFIAVPTQSAYNATKFAVRGMTEAMRQELAGSGITVSCVHPGGIKTNIVNNARFYRSADGRAQDKGQAAIDFEKMARTTPEQAAKTIVRGMEKRSPRILIGPDAHVIDAMVRLTPVNYTKLISGLSNALRK